MNRRVKVLPVRGFDEHIQGWAITVGSWELGFYTGRIKALNMGHLYARELAIVIPGPPRHDLRPATRDTPRITHLRGYPLDFVQTARCALHVCP